MFHTLHFNISHCVFVARRLHFVIERSFRLSRSRRKGLYSFNKIPQHNGHRFKLSRPNMVVKIQQLQLGGVTYKMQGKPQKNSCDVDAQIWTWPTAGSSGSPEERLRRTTIRLRVHPFNCSPPKTPNFLVAAFSLATTGIFLGWDCDGVELMKTKLFEGFQTALKLQIWGKRRLSLKSTYISQNLKNV